MTGSIESNFSNTNAAYLRFWNELNGQVSCCVDPRFSEKHRSGGHGRHRFFDNHFPEVTPEQIAGLDALISLAPRISAETLSGADSKLCVIARFGVGYDMVDVKALTERGVMLTITPDGVRRPMASGIVGFILALSLNMFSKFKVLREGRWNDRIDVKSIGLTGRVLGSIGLGNIGLEIFRLMKPFDIRQTTMLLHLRNILSLICRKEKNYINE